MAGYIKIHRNILEWEWWSDIKTYRLFTYMILKANWKDGRFKGVEVPKGSFVSSLGRLSEETSLTINEVRTALKHLEKTNEITSKSHGKFTVYTVKNYSSYQEDNKETTGKPQATDEPQTDNTQATNEPQADNKQTTRKSQTDNKEVTSRPQGNHKQITSNSQADNKELTTIEEGNKERKEEVKERKNGKKEEEGITVSNETVCQTDVRHIVDAWNGLESCGIKTISKINSSSQRYQRLVARIKQYSTADVLSAINRIRGSDFLQGKNNRGWTITFDWFVLPNNFPKVLEGNYDNKTAACSDNKGEIDWSKV